MSDADQRTSALDLFRETGPAHPRAYRSTNGDDTVWPMWYAEFLHARLNQLLGYYTDFFMNRYGDMRGHMPAAPTM